MWQRLGEVVVAVRAVAPQAIGYWVKLHANICGRIIAEGGGSGPNREVRLNLAQEALGEWEKVLTGALNYVRINEYFLDDYDREVKMLVRNARGGG